MHCRLAFALLASALAIFSAAASTLFAQSPAGRREIRVGVPGIPDSIEPGTAIEGAGVLIARQVFDTLVSYREASTDIDPSLATRWSVSRDGLIWSFTLRDNVHFHDGKALTAAEAVVSLERPLKVGTRPAAAAWTALLRGAPGVVREIRAAGPKTVQFILHQPYAPLLTVLAHPGFGIAREGSGGEGQSRLVGTGPYRITEATAGRIVIDAVPGHWAGPPRVERLVFLDVATDDHAEAEFDAKALDIWFPSGPPRRQQGALSIPGPRVGYLAFQTEREPFSRKTIRQSIAAGIDPGVLGVALGTAAVPLQSYLPAGVWARREGSPVLGGTRQTVAALLKQGQWPAGFTPTLLASAEGGSVDVGLVAEALRLSLETVDIPVKVRLEAPEVAAAARAAGDHDMALAEGSLVGGDPHLFLYPLSTSEGATRGRQAFNFSFYKNPRLDDMLIRASQLAFRPERQRLYQRAQAVLAEEMPWLPLYVRLQWGVARPEVRGLRLHPTGFHRLSTVTLEGPASSP
jgi:peptide/nickel transport system substrate-binding protein